MEGDDTGECDSVSFFKFQLDVNQTATNFLSEDVADTFAIDSFRCYSAVISNTQCAYLFQSLPLRYSKL